MQTSLSKPDKPSQPLGQFLRLMNRRSRNGQSILIVAIAFIALIAFVGIAVDVALLFVRYSSLSRAVDAASIAAAGQVREGVEYPTLQAVAEQFVKLQGNVDVRTVRVETCETEIHEYVLQELAAGRPRPADPLADILRKNPPSELCKQDPQKLIRVSAQLESPTTFLSLIGWPRVLLEASSVSQTATLDVALVIDNSISMTYDTYSEQATYPKNGANNNSEALRAFRPFLDFNNDSGANDLNPYTTDADNNGLDDGNGQRIIRRECWVNPSPDSNGGLYAANYAWGGCCNDPATQTDPPATTADRLNWYIYDSPELTDAYIQVNGASPAPGNPPAATVTSGGRDGNFSDLLCRPFKQVRDAARRFIKRLDFVRGDRLFLVTFNANVEQVRPVNMAAPKDRNQDSSVPVITSKAIAIETLNQKVGASVNANGRQRGCLSFERATPENPINWRRAYNYWTTAQCTDTNMGGGIYAAHAAITDPRYVRRDSVWVMVLLSDGFPNRTPSYQQFVVDGLGTGSATGLNWLAVPDDPGVCGDNTARPCNPTEIDEYCELDRNNPRSGLQPQYCYRGNKPNIESDWGATDNGAFRSSFGFCPWYTFCNRDGNSQASVGGPTSGGLPVTYPAFCTASDSQPPWWSTDPETAGFAWQGEPAYPFCLDWSPDTRHFCTDASGNLTLTPGSCQPEYDPDDFARDMADYAGLIDYTQTRKGSFIAMFTIFFAQRDPIMGTTANVSANILGVKMLRYIADAGDNGVIDNHLQAWYRATRGANLNTVKDLAADPTGNVFLPGGNVNYRVVDGTGRVIVDPNTPQDPCANFDYKDVLSPGTSRTPGIAPVSPGSAAYEAMAKSDCGQFWYARDIKKVNEAFAEIASRLFTRLSR